MVPQQKGSQNAQEAVREDWGRRELTRAFRVRSVNEATGYFLLFIMGTLMAEDLTWKGIMMVLLLSNATFHLARGKSRRRVTNAGGAGGKGVERSVGAGQGATAGARGGTWGAGGFKPAGEGRPQEGEAPPYRSGRPR